jgi:3-methyladenine DNA glycosylase AlkD
MTPRQLAMRAHKWLRASSEPRFAEGQKRYFRQWQTITFYGVKMPKTKRIERELYHSVRKAWTYSEAVIFCDLLMHDPHLEAKAVGLLMLERYQRHFEENLVDKARAWLEAGLCDNWAVTDDLATGVLWRLLERFEDLAARFEAWRTSPNLWLRRAGVVVFVKSASEGKHLDRIYRIAAEHFSDDQDLMHKACGWLLREAGKAGSGRLEKYLLRHGSAIPRTTVRYAIEGFPEAKRRKVLARTRI